MATHFSCVSIRWQNYRLHGHTATFLRQRVAAERLPSPIPPDDELTEIVRRVEALFALTNRIEARCSAARAQRQTPLVLAKAFRGELVAQDPKDEPASALLARIASSNTAVVGKNKRKVPVALKEISLKAINL
jgi:type I restriction enzyme S subunit